MKLKWYQFITYTAISAAPIATLLSCGFDEKTTLQSQNNIIKHHHKQINQSFKTIIKPTNSKKMIEEEIKILIKHTEQFLRETSNACFHLLNTWSNFRFTYDKAYLIKFNQTIQSEENIILTNLKDIKQKIIQSKITETFKFKQELTHEIDKLHAHQLTIKNLLYNVYKSNGRGFNKKINPWEIVTLNPEAYKYYLPLLNKSGDDLINAVNQLISSTMKEKHEGSKAKNYHELWTLFKTPGFKDIDRNKEHSILDIYSKNPSGQDAFNYTDKHQQTQGGAKKPGEAYNREHLIPKSHFKEEAPMYYDGHHIWPSDAWTNTQRSNHHHGIVVKPVNTKFVNKARMGYDKDNKMVFEPDEAFKGDIARTYLYFALRYHQFANNFVKEKTAFIKQKPFIKEPQLSIMLDWHENIDYVDKRDLNRNEEIYKFQGNRNPFVDLPFLSKLIWNPYFQNVKLVFD